MEDIESKLSLSKNVPILADLVLRPFEMLFYIMEMVRLYVQHYGTFNEYRVLLCL